MPVSSGGRLSARAAPRAVHHSVRVRPSHSRRVRASARSNRRARLCRVPRDQFDDNGHRILRDAVSGTTASWSLTSAGTSICNPPCRQSNLTIAGQTAPVDASVSWAGEVSFNAAIERDCALRGFAGHARSERKEERNQSAQCQQPDCDHISIEFAQYEALTRGGDQHHRARNSIVADPTGQQFGAHTEMTGGFFTLVTATCGPRPWVRQPLAKSNTQYGQQRGLQLRLRLLCRGPPAASSARQSSTTTHCGPVDERHGRHWYQMNSGQTVYASGNLLDSNKDGTLNGTDAGSPADDQGDEGELH